MLKIEIKMIKDARKRHENNTRFEFQLNFSTILQTTPIILEDQNKMQ